MPTRDKAGRPPKDEGEIGSNSQLLPDHRTESGIIRRLKRHNPQLAKAVIDGTTTATQAAREMGCS